MTVFRSRVCFGLMAVWLLGATIDPAFGACDQIQILQDRSRGVAILLNTCQSKTGIAPGTLLRLAPGARLWLTSTGDEGSQMVCQNQTDKSLTLLVNQTDPPWLTQGTGSCQFRERRFICHNGENTALLCVVAPLAQSPVTDRPQQGTSLVLRSAFAAKGLQDPSHRQAVIAKLKQTAKLCHQLYGVDRTYTVSWTVDPAGKVASMDVPAKLTQSHPELADCLVDLIRTFPYPRSSQAVRLSAPM